MRQLCWREGARAVAGRTVALEKGSTWPCSFVAECAPNNVSNTLSNSLTPQITNRGGKFTDMPTGNKPSGLRGVDLQRFKTSV